MKAFPPSHAVVGVDSSDNDTINDVIGNKEDAGSLAAGDYTEIMVTPERLSRSSPFDVMMPDSLSGRRDGRELGLQDKTLVRLSSSTEHTSTLTRTYKEKYMVFAQTEEGVEVKIKLLPLISLVGSVITIVFLTGGAWYETKQTRKSFDEVKTKFALHCEKGIHGLPHPAGIVAELEQMKKEYRRLSGNRWTRYDDAYWASALARLNPSLVIPKHDRAPE